MEKSKKGTGGRGTEEERREGVKERQIERRYLDIWEEAVENDETGRESSWSQRSGVRESNNETGGRGTEEGRRVGVREKVRGRESILGIREGAGERNGSRKKLDAKEWSKSNKETGGKRI